MSVLEQTLPPLDQSVLSQQLDMPQVDLPPEDCSNLSRLVPELDLLDDKGKDKDKDDSDEEVRWLVSYRVCLNQTAKNSVFLLNLISFLFPSSQ